MRHNRISKVGPAALAGLLTGAALWAASVWAPPAQAGPLDDSFLSQLGGAGVSVNDPITAESVGRSVCPKLTQPAGQVASAAAPLTGLTSGHPMPPEMAQLFTEIAVQVYCPQMMTQLASGQLPELPQIPGLTGGAPGAPGLSIPIPGLAR